MPCRSANSPKSSAGSMVHPVGRTDDRRRRTDQLYHPSSVVGRPSSVLRLIADIVVALAAVEAAGAQAAFFESAVRSRTGTGRCGRASRSAPCRRARRGRRAVLAFRTRNPRLRLREVSKGRRAVVVTSHGSLLLFDRESGQGGRIRTYDLLVPSQERCQAAPRPEIGPSSRTRTCDLPVRNRVLCSD
jgi:hypothetical protein